MFWRLIRKLENLIWKIKTIRYARQGDILVSRWGPREAWKGDDDVGGYIPCHPTPYPKLGQCSICGSEFALLRGIAIPPHLVYICRNGHITEIEDAHIQAGEQS